ncbi:MAG: DUF1461 domain-containing protein [Acidobacteriota bacterium]|nr:DUF1461 domain-containing protein [Acidobacteriota bacterium]
MIKFFTVPKIVLIISLPLLILLTNLYIVTSSRWLNYEYPKLFSLPAEYHYFTNSQRLEFAEATLRFICSDEDPDFLRSLRVEGLPIYSEREISHLLEVKNLIQRLFDIRLIVFIASLLSILILLLNREYRQKIPLYVQKGCLLLVLLVGVLLITVLINWNKLFLHLHCIFFPQGNYTFPYSFTIIQLFPPGFWFNTALLGLILALTETGILAGCMFWIRKKIKVKGSIDKMENLNSGNKQKKRLKKSYLKML